MRVRTWHRPGPELPAPSPEFCHLHVHVDISTIGRERRLTWHLATEEQFYLFWPFAFVAIARRMVFRAHNGRDCLVTDHYVTSRILPPGWLRVAPEAPGATHPPVTVRCDQGRQFHFCFQDCLGKGSNGLRAQSSQREDQTNSNDGSMDFKKSL
jgi:hypothetical protein